MWSADCLTVDEILNFNPQTVVREIRIVIRISGLELASHFVDLKEACVLLGALLVINRIKSLNYVHNCQLTSVFCNEYNSHVAHVAFTGDGN